VIERRRTKRFAIRLPVEVVRQSFQPVSSIGETRDLSAGGVLFSANLRVELGEPLEYIIGFPSHSNLGPGVSLRCLGKVVRVEPNGASVGQDAVMVAATLERYEFVRPES
jgi:hypothetical protein